MSVDRGARPRVLFAIPPEPPSLYRDLGNEPSMHIGLAYVATYVARRLDVRVRVVDAPVEKIDADRFARLLTEYRPDVLAMTAYTFQIQNAARTARQAKEILPGVRTVIGGYHAGAIPERTLREFPDLDFAVFGEGEETAVELIGDLVSGGDGIGIFGTAGRTGDEVVVNQPRGFIQDLTQIPFPDFSLFRIKKYANTIDPPAMFWLRCIPLLVNRGCPFNCTFCFRSFPGKVRYRPVEHVMDEIDRDLREYRANRLIFMDETFSVSRDYAERFLEAMIQKGYASRLRWMCQTRVDQVDENWLKLVRRAGCRFVCFGIESYREDAQKKIRKRFELDQVRRMVRYGKRLGLRIQTTFILGLPGETEESARSLIRTTIDLNPSFATFSILTPFPGTAIYEMAKRGEEGLRLLSEDWSRYGKQIAGALELENLPLARLLALQMLAYRRFYFRPSKFLNLFLVVSPVKVLRYMLGYVVRKIRPR